MQNTNDYVAAEVRAIIARQGISASALAARLNESPMWLSRRTRGIVPLTVGDLARIAAALGVEPRSLFVLEQPQTTEAKGITR